MRILVSAYACEPGRGSEPGVGWNWARQIARLGETWVITRANNRPAIEAELAERPEPDLHFCYVDLPRWARFWKKGRRGIHLYYYLWQFAALARARELAGSMRFDLAHHLTFVNDWLPASLALLPLPFVWGPVGGNRPAPAALLGGAGPALADRLRSLTRRALRRMDPLYRLTVARSRRVILISEAQRRLFPFRLLPPGRLAVQAANGVDVPPVNPARREEGTLIYTAGSLIPVKGFHLALEAVGRLRDSHPEARLVISGDGPWRSRLRALARGRGLSGAVTFTGELQRREVLERMGAASIFLFPSFEGGGMVVLEAMAAGLPVVCLDWGGPGDMVTDACGVKVRPGSRERTVSELAEALRRLAADPGLRRRMGEAGRRRAAERYSWEAKGEFLRGLYEEVLG